jgi:hypothetical protein
MILKLYLFDVKKKMGAVPNVWLKKRICFLLKETPNTFFSIRTTPAQFSPAPSHPGHLIAILMADFQKFQLMTISTYDLTSSRYTDIEEVVRRDL